VFVGVNGFSDGNVANLLRPRFKAVGPAALAGATAPVESRNTPASEDTTRTKIRLAALPSRKVIAQSCNMLLIYISESEAINVLIKNIVKGPHVERIAERNV
jgi:hypothetical protein